jgi:hypothetical protein
MSSSPWKKGILIAVWVLLIIVLFGIGFKLVLTAVQPAATAQPVILITASIPNTVVLPTIAATPSATLTQIISLMPSSTNLPTSTPIPTFTRYIPPTWTETSEFPSETVPIPVGAASGTVPIPVGQATATP